ncbi:hypothetical protein H2200_009315 [Cladophialophora chaetospira]|uniref:Transporter n=1 Tax=Cladophialophora chaetospira TaxID=386627 RepID=A0AA39CFH6_9EURO|nr:hypothetical protein H2200_009315 [Cladophialophora chaetospira]
MDYEKASPELRENAEKSHNSVDEVEVPESLAIKRKLERRLVWKQDLTMLPLLAMCFFFSYVIGNARILGLQKDLNLSADKYYNALLVFFIGYMIIELPCCLGLIYIKPGHQFGLATIAFGLLATCIAATHDYGSLIAIRFLLGLSEAFVQVGFVYLSLWYRHDEIALRCALFYVSGPLAGAASGLIAYGVGHNLQDAQGIAAWRWLFIVEGVPTMAWGILTFFALPGRPEVVAEKGTWLFSKQAERELIRERTLSAKNSLHSTFNRRQVLVALGDAKSWLDALIVAGFGLGVAAFGLFMPTFIKEFGFSPLHTQLFTIIPYATAALALPMICACADRFVMRAVPLIFCYVLCAAGFILLLITTNKAARIAGTCFVSAGSYSGVILAATWVMSTHSDYTKRSTAWAMCQLFLQCWSILGTKIYDKPPRFFKGHGILLGLQTVAAACVVFKWWLMRSANKRKDAMKEEFAANGGSAPRAMEEEIDETHPDFRYLL